MQRVVVFDMYTSIMQSTHDQESSIVTIYYKAWSPFINYVNTWIHNHFEQIIIRNHFIKSITCNFKEFICQASSTLSSLCSKCNVNNQKLKTKVSIITTTSKFIPKCNGKQSREVAVQYWHIFVNFAWHHVSFEHLELDTIIDLSLIVIE